MKRSVRIELATFKTPTGCTHCVFQPEFLAVCDSCGQTTPWFKANQMLQSDDGRPVAVKGYKCASCGTFEQKVLDSRGRIQERD